MRNCSRQDLITATRGLVAVWILAIPGVVGAQQSHSRYMEETAVTSTTDPIVENAPSIKRAGVETRDRVVEYSDLNLDNPAGISTLYTRLEAASRFGCARDRGQITDSSGGPQRTVAF